MSPYDIAAIERHARQLRAEEIRRINGLFADRLCLVGRLLAATAFNAILALAEAIRPLFSWNPQEQTPSDQPRVALSVRANRIARRLFAWNPEVHHHV